jgi:hypothetical protein
MKDTHKLLVETELSVLDISLGCIYEPLYDTEC